MRGPYVARSESLAVKPQFESQTMASDPNAAKAVYVADVPFKRNGKQAVIAIAKLDGRLLMTNGYSVNVTPTGGSGPPDVGDRAISVHTQTLADVGGDAAQLDTRRPVAKDLLQTDLADVLGKQPVVITFATPLLCPSRVCGPVVDIVEQVKASAPKGVAFIHQEIYKDNQVNKGVRSQVGGLEAARASRGPSSSIARAGSARASRAPSRSASCSARWPRSPRCRWRVPVRGARVRANAGLRHLWQPMGRGRAPCRDAPGRDVPAV